ncbi:MAG: hypothetical protein ACW981_10260 [Candidatus Hodarchaeales archaeon]|jgi:hypothetical protein
MINTFDDFLRSHSWLTPAFSRTLKSSKSLKSLSLLLDNSLNWIETKGLDKNDISLITETTFRGISSLWKNTFQTYFGQLTEFEIEGGQNRFYYSSLDASIWWGSISSNIESNFQHIQDLLINSLDFQIDLDQLTDDQFLAIITTEGFNLWLKSKLPEFLLEDAITASLSALERLQLELKIGNVKESSLLTNNNKILEIVMNNSNELAITKYDNNIKYDSLINKFFKNLIRTPHKINIPEHIVEYFKSISTQTVNPLMEEMKTTPIESEISEDEMLSLIGFDEALLDRMEKTIIALASAYNIREISIPYLGKKIFRLPSVVIQLSLSYLIGQGRIKNAKLKFTSADVLVPDILELDFFSPSEEEKKVIADLSVDYKNILDLLENFLSILENFQHFKPTSNIFNELEAIRQNTDSYPLITLSRDISIIITSLKEKISLLDKKESEEKTKLQERIKIDIESLKMKMSRLREDIQSFYSFLFRFLPFPKAVNEYKEDNKVELLFTCSYDQCEMTSSIEITKSIETWKKFLIFLKEKKQSSSIIEFVKSHTKQLFLLNSDINEQTVKDMSWNIDSLILTNEERESLIEDTIRNKENTDISNVNQSQCEVCQNWFCSSHFIESQFKCKIHQKLTNI